MQGNLLFILLAVLQEKNISRRAGKPERGTGDIPQNPHHSAYDLRLAQYNAEAGCVLV